MLGMTALGRAYLFGQYMMNKADSPNDVKRANPGNAPTVSSPIILRTMFVLEIFVLGTLLSLILLHLNSTITYCIENSGKR